jgi:diguanylate cyclase
VMVNSTIELAHRLGLKVVAEGIETQEILTMLTQMGCDVAQGYHIARPMRFQALATLILGDTVVRAA